MAKGRFRTILSVPGVAWLLGTSLVARLPVAMVNLAIILRVVHASGSYARAGAIAACYVLGTGFGYPLLGRLADRAGRRPVLVGAGILNATGLITLAAVSTKSTSVFVIAVLAGLCLPPVAPAVRSLWRNLVGEDLSNEVYAVDATLQEVTFMAGPALVAGISAAWSPSAALAASGLIGLAGTLAVSAHRATASTGAAGEQLRRQAPARGVRAGSPVLLVLAAMTGLFLLGMVIVEIAVIAFAGEHHASHQAGFLLATWSTGSFVGGLTIGARVARGGVSRVRQILLVMAAAVAVVSAAPTVPVLYVFLLVSGVVIAPGFSGIYALVGQYAPETASIEAFSWIASAIQFGAAVGSAAGGVLVEWVGTRQAMLCAAGVAVLTAAVARGARRFFDEPVAGQAELAEGTTQRPTPE